MLIGHTHNELTWSPSHGQPLSPDGYRDLFETIEPRIFGEADLFADVVAAGRSICRGATTETTLDASPALTIIASRHPACLRARIRSTPPPAPPASSGSTRSTRSSRTATRCALRLQFPTDDYEDEYGACRQYLPDDAGVDRALSTALSPARPPASSPTGAPPGHRRPAEALLLSLALHAHSVSRIAANRYYGIYVAITVIDVMQNPFVYGEVVPAGGVRRPRGRARRLVARPRRRPEDLPDLAAPLRQVVADPPRAGGDGRRGALTVEVTVSSFSSYVAFLEGYARALVAAETKWDRARDVAARRDSVGARRSPLHADPTPAPARCRCRFPACDPIATSRAWRRRCSRCRRRLADARKRKVVVALDEFQAIGGFNGGSVEHALRAAVQHQRDVGYVFAGSEPSLMERMLGPKRPFYKAGPVMRLEKIPADEFAAFIDARFTRSGMQARSRARRGDRRARPATCPTTCSGSRTKPGTRCARAARPARDARRSAPGAASGCSPSSR